MNTLRFSVLIGALAVALSSPALAQTCTNDVDCSGTTCGGMVCQWMDATTHSCVPASANDWCTTNTDCKCNGLGATCTQATHHCTFVTPDGAPHDAGTTTHPASGGCSVGPMQSTALPGLLMVGLGALLYARARRRR